MVGNNTKENWPDTESTREYLREHWQEPWGDRRQELVFIGSGIDWPSLNAALDNCLVNDDAVNSIRRCRTCLIPFLFGNSLRSKSELNFLVSVCLGAVSKTEA